MRVELLPGAVRDVAVYDIRADALYIDPEMSLDGTVELALAMLDRAGYPLCDAEVRGLVREFLASCPASGASEDGSGESAKR